VAKTNEGAANDDDADDDDTDDADNDADADDDGVVNQRWSLSRIDVAKTNEDNAADAAEDIAANGWSRIDVAKTNEDDAANDVT
jgi:hypothetical protein